VSTDVLEPYNAVDPTALDRPLALWLESKLDEERYRGREVVDHDAHVVHALDRHALDGSGNVVHPASTARSSASRSVTACLRLAERPRSRLGAAAG
jgi:hypothetical protein